MNLVMPLTFAWVALAPIQIYTCGNWGLRMHCAPVNAAAIIEQKLPPLGEDDLVNRWFKQSYILVGN